MEQRRVDKSTTGKQSCNRHDCHRQRPLEVPEASLDGPWGGPGGPWRVPGRSLVASLEVPGRSVPGGTLDHQMLCFPGNLKGPRCKPCSVHFSSVQLFEALLRLPFPWRCPKVPCQSLRDSLTSMHPGSSLGLLWRSAARTKSNQRGGHKTRHTYKKAPRERRSRIQKEEGRRGEDRGRRGSRRWMKRLVGQQQLAIQQVRIILVAEWLEDAAEENLDR